MSLGSIYSLKRSFIDESVLAGSQQQLGAGAEEQLWVEGAMHECVLHGAMLLALLCIVASSPPALCLLHGVQISPAEGGLSAAAADPGAGSRAAATATAACSRSSCSQGTLE